MKSNTNKKISRWGVIALIAILILLIVGGAIYAQELGMNRRPDAGHGPDRDQGPGMMPGRGGGGPEALIGAQFLMQDKEIRNLMGQIKIIEMINKLELTRSQVETLRDLSTKAQSIMNDEFDSTRVQIREQLKDQLNAALSGSEIDREFVPRILERARDEHDPAEIKEKLQGILESTIDLFTDEQREMLMRHSGPNAEKMRERIGEEFRGRMEQGRERFENLPEEQRNRIEQGLRERVGEMREGAAKIKVMMLLLSPEASKAMDLWLDHN